MQVGNYGSVYAEGKNQNCVESRPIFVHSILNKFTAICISNIPVRVTIQKEVSRNKLHTHD